MNIFENIKRKYGVLNTLFKNSNVRFIKLVIFILVVINKIIYSFSDIIKSFNITVKINQTGYHRIFYSKERFWVRLL